MNWFMFFGSMHVIPSVSAWTNLQRDGFHINSRILNKYISGKNKFWNQIFPTKIANSKSGGLYSQLWK